MYLLVAFTKQIHCTNRVKHAMKELKNITGFISYADFNVI